MPEHARQHAGLPKTGRPRDPDADRRILEATLQLVSERGYESLRVTDIADRAGVSKATMYRRWSSKAHLAVAAVRSLPNSSEIDTGDLRKDLGSIVEEFAKMFVTTPLSSVLPALVVEASRDPELALALEPLRDERTRPIIVALQRGLARGEIAPTLDLDFAVSLVTGPVLARLFLGDSIEDGFAQRVADAAVRSLAS
jgi:AcrR family transcriptional regulator